MPAPLRLIVVLTALAALLAASLSAAAVRETEYVPVTTVRAEDRIAISASTAHLGLTENIVLHPVKATIDPPRPGATKITQVIISPLWIRERGELRPAFTDVRPYLTVTGARVRNMSLVRPDGETARFPQEMTPECKWVLTLQVSHATPARILITVTMQQPSGIRPEAELLYTPSNDGHPPRSGPPEAFFSQVRVSAEGALDPWVILQGDKVLSRFDSSGVRLERDVPHTIHFGENAAALMPMER